MLHKNVIDLLRLSVKGFFLFFFRFCVMFKFIFDLVLQKRSSSDKSKYKIVVKDKLHAFRFELLCCFMSRLAS